jgi:hypothetical protein
MSNHQEPQKLTSPQGRPISGFSLSNIGFKKIGVEYPPNRHVIVAIYQRDKDIVKYDGVNWFLNDSKIKTMEDIK